MLSGCVSAQTVSYNIRIFGSNVGKMVINHTRESDGTDLYTMESNSDIKLLWIAKHYRSKFEARFKDGKMISSSHLETEGDKVKRWAKVLFDGTKYLVDSDKGKRSFTEVPAYCDVSMYFEDCRKVKRLFYLADADFDNVTHTSDSNMEFKSGDGHRNVYFLENGKIKLMEFHLTLATVFMTRVD